MDDDLASDIWCWGGTKASVEHRLDYSGRGMEGRTTSALEVDDRYSLDVLLMDIGAYCQEHGVERPRVRVDNMGRGYVVY